MRINVVEEFSRKGYSALLNLLIIALKIPTREHEKSSRTLSFPDLT